MKKYLNSVFSKEKAQLYLEVLKQLEIRKRQIHFSHSSNRDKNDAVDVDDLKDAVVLVEAVGVCVLKSDKV